MSKVLFVMGSDSDFDVLKSGLKLLKDFGIETKTVICSAHRTPDAAAAMAKSAEADGFDVIIAAAGKAAHLPGVLAAFTPLPVIGIPIKSAALDGMDALFSIVQMPPGIPVATVAIDGADNAAILAAQIIGLKNGAIRQKIKDYKKGLEKKVDEKNSKLSQKLAESGLS